MSDEQARREEERLMKSINRQPGQRKPTWTPQKQTVNTVTVATTSAPQKVSSGTGETWREKQERLERERKEREASEKKEVKKDEPRSRPTSTYGTSSLSVNKSVPPSSSATTSTSAEVAEFEKMIGELDAPKSNDKRSSNKPNLDELDSLISSFEKKPEPTPEPEPVHIPAPAPAPTQPAAKPTGATELNSTFDELEGLLLTLDKKPNYSSPSPKPVTTTPSPAPVAAPVATPAPTAFTTTTSQSSQNIDSYKPAPVASSSTSRDICGRCNQAIQGEKMVAMGMKWHKDHFTCFKCNVPLTDTFVPKDGNPFCENCYQNSMKCTKCDLPISGTHIDAKGKLYHIECAGGEACAKCGGAIDKVSVQAADRMWHQECFKCFNCGSGLVDSYVRKDKEVWCTKCYSSEMMCDKCNQPLPTTYVATKGKKYHSDCFTCGTCSKALGSNYYDVEGVFQCENCYQNTIGRCATCGNALDGQFVKCLDKKYHEKCFVCSGCRTPLEEDFYNVGGNPSCYNCATKA